MFTALWSWEETALVMWVQPKQVSPKLCSRGHSPPLWRHLSWARCSLGSSTNTFAWRSSVLMQRQSSLHTPLGISSILTTSSKTAASSLDLRRGGDFCSTLRASPCGRVSWRSARLLACWWSPKRTGSTSYGSSPLGSSFRCFTARDWEATSLVKWSQASASAHWLSCLPTTFRRPRACTPFPRSIWWSFRSPWSSTLKPYFIGKLTVHSFVNIAPIITIIKLPGWYVKPFNAFPIDLSKIASRRTCVQADKLPIYCIFLDVLLLSERRLTIDNLKYRQVCIQIHPIPRMKI